MSCHTNNSLKPQLDSQAFVRVSSAGARSCLSQAQEPTLHSFHSPMAMGAMAAPWEHRADPLLSPMPWTLQGSPRRDQSNLIDATRAQGESHRWEWAHAGCGYQTLPVAPQQHENLNNHGP